MQKISEAFLRGKSPQICFLANKIKQRFQNIKELFPTVNVLISNRKSLRIKNIRQPFALADKKKKINVFRIVQGLESAFGSENLQKLMYQTHCAKVQKYEQDKIGLQFFYMWC